MATIDIINSHAEFFAKFIQMIPFPQSEIEESLIGSYAQKSPWKFGKNSENIKTINNNINDFLSTTPQEIWTKYQNKMSALKVNRKLSKKKREKSTQKKLPKRPKKKIKNPQNIKTQANTEQSDNFQFSNFTFKNKINVNDVMAKKKDYNKLFISAEKKAREISQLENESSKGAQKKLTETHWKRAIDKAEGVKVRDDLGKLKKSWKNAQKRKLSSKKAFTERFELQEQRIQNKQAKREKNIIKRKEQRILKKKSKRR